MSPMYHRGDVVSLRVSDHLVGKFTRELAGVWKRSPDPENLDQHPGGEAEEETQDRGRGLGAEPAERLPGDYTLTHTLPKWLHTTTVCGYGGGDNHKIQ